MNDGKAIKKKRMKIEKIKKEWRKRKSNENKEGRWI